MSTHDQHDEHRGDHPGDEPQAGQPSGSGGLPDWRAVSPVSRSMVAGLATEVEALRRAVRPLGALAPRVEEVAGLVAELADQIATGAAGSTRAAAPSWLTAPHDTDTVGQMFGELVAWLEQVYLRYPDAALPECWAAHPDVVEELVWLMHQWCSAYQAGEASAWAAGEWHDRFRPGVVARIAYATSCSPAAHRPDRGRPDPTAPRPVPGAGAELIVSWWAGSRDQPAPIGETTPTPRTSTGTGQPSSDPHVVPFADAAAGSVWS